MSQFQFHAITDSYCVEQKHNDVRFFKLCYATKAHRYDDDVVQSINPLFPYISNKVVAVVIC